jgi:GNAT superfamily N-acetyltransferase
MNAAPPAAAVVRRAGPADLPAIVAAADAVFRPQAGRPGLGSMGHDYPLLFDAANAGNLVVVEVEGRLVGHAGFTLQEAVAAGTTFRVACFGSVFTVAGHEGRGHATAAVAEAIRLARAAGAELGLVSGDRGLYLRAGFQPYPPCRRWRVARGSAPAGGDATATRLAPEALPAIATLYAGEPVRFVRPLADWQRLVATGVVFFHPAELFVVERCGRTAGYVVLGRRAGGGGAPGYRALELAGDRAAIAAALPSLLDLLAVEALDLVAAPHDEALAAIAAQQGWPAEELRFEITAAWWNPALAHLPYPWYGLNYV